MRGGRRGLRLPAVEDLIESPKELLQRLFLSLRSPDQPALLSFPSMIDSDGQQPMKSFIESIASTSGGLTWPQPSEAWQSLHKRARRPSALSRSLQDEHRRHASLCLLIIPFQKQCFIVVIKAQMTSCALFATYLKMIGRGCCGSGCAGVTAASLEASSTRPSRPPNSLLTKLIHQIYQQVRPKPQRIVARTSRSTSPMGVL